MHVHDWTIHGADNQPILGNTHVPDGSPRGVLIIAHGFKGYKDYGMFPRIASRCADAGFIAHCFNFSHSGMTNRIPTFERPDLFERDTWNKQVFDLRAVIGAVAAGELQGGVLPLVLFGHSRGGVAVLLTAGRFADDSSFLQPAGIITAAAPDRCNSLSDDDARRLLEEGFLDSPSSRTGQTLRVGSAFLQEQLDDPSAHNVLALAARIRCPMLIIHGENDPTVPVEAAARIAEAAGDRATKLVIPAADHVFNTPNPLPDTAPAGAHLEALISAAMDFSNRAAAR